MSRVADSLSRSPWIEGLPAYRDLAAIRQAVIVRASRVDGLDRLPRTAAEERLRDALELIYIPGDQHCDALLNVLEQLRTFVAGRYPDARHYLSTINRPQSTLPTINSIRCLTGLAGVGKTCMIAAIKRLMQGDRIATIDINHPDILIRYVRSLTVNTKSSNRDLMIPLANPAFVAGRRGAAVGDLGGHVRAWLHTTGSGLLLVDELQFLTQSQTANTRVAQVLMMMGYLGIPVLYAANYSLCHRLVRRPQEERQRLLVEPIDLHPEAPDSLAWRQLIDEYVRVAPEIFQVDPATHAQELNRLTAGTGRLLKILFVLAFGHACDRRGARLVTIDDLRSAYRSEAFSTMREDVEALASLSVSPLLVAKRPDLVSPFRGERGTEAVTQLGQRTVHPSQAAESALLAPLAVAYQLESTLSPDAKRMLAAMRGDTDPVQTPAHPRKSARTRSGPAKITAEALYAGAKLTRSLTHPMDGAHKDQKRDDA